MGQPESKLAVHPVVVVGDGDGDGDPPSPLQNVTASSRAAASGGSFSVEKKGGRSPSVEDDNVGDDEDDDEDDAEAAERAIRAIVDAQGWEVTRLDPAVLDEVNNYYGFAGGRTTRGSRSAEKAAETSAADNAEGADGVSTRGAAVGASSPVSSDPDASATTAADASASASLVQRIDRFLFPPPKVSFHEFSQSATAPDPQSSSTEAAAHDGGVGQRSRRRWRRSDSAPASSGAGTSVASTPAVPTTTLLWGADSNESHDRRIQDALSLMKGRRGAEGLRAAGFEFRRVLCGRHADGAALGADCVDSEEEGGAVAVVETGKEEEEGRGNDVEREKEEEKGEGSHSEIEARGWGRQRSMSDGDAEATRQRRGCRSGDGSPPSVGPGRRRRRSSHGDGGDGARKGGKGNDDEGADVADSGSEVKPPRGRSQSDPLCSSHHRRDADSDLDEQERCNNRRRRPWTEVVPRTTTNPAHDVGEDVAESSSAVVHERGSTRAGEFGAVDRDRYESGASSLETVDCGDGDKDGENVGVNGSAENNTLRAKNECGGGDVDGEKDMQDSACGKSPFTNNVIESPQDNDEDHRRVDDGFVSDDRSSSFCAECVTRLHHIPSSAVITPENRSRYIADGEMYDEVARLCQEYVHDLMAEEGNLEWVTVCDDKRRGEPVRALVDREHQLPDNRGSVDVRREGRDDLETLVVDSHKNGSVETDGASNHAAETRAHSHPRTRPTLLIVTGKGKVRAGVFSRSHLLSSGIEPSTALPMVREARRRGMAVVLLDPNARGDRKGMETFELSVEALFGSGQDTHGEELDVDFPSAAGGAKDEAKGSETAGHEPKRRRSHRHHHHNPMYILAYSASGGQLVRYLMDASNPFLNRIRAIAFTDSTHNFQWTRNDPRLSSLLESPSCVYVRSANARRDGLGKSRTYRAGEEVRTDHYWRRRFGTVRTVWAGTAVHELANWAAHAHIWEHFDRHHSVRHLLQRDGGHGGSKAEEEEEEGSDDRSAASSGAEPRGSRRFRSRDFGAITV